jgi:hypothetical protein
VREQKGVWVNLILNPFTPQSELEAEQELESASNEFNFEETPGDIPTLDFSEGTEGSLGEFDFESFHPSIRVRSKNKN